MEGRKRRCVHDIMELSRTRRWQMRKNINNIDLHANRFNGVLETEAAARDRQAVPGDVAAGALQDSEMTEDVGVFDGFVAGEGDGHNVTAEPIQNERREGMADEDDSDNNVGHEDDGHSGEDDHPDDIQGDEGQERVPDNGDQDGNNHQHQNPYRALGGEQGGEPVYEGAPITLIESMLSILALSVAHNLTSACLSDILSVIYMHCKKPTLFSDSLYKFRKFFEKVKSPIKRHYYCSRCFSYLENENSPCLCDNRTQVSYFIEISIIHQLKSLFARNGFYEDLQHRFQRPANDFSVSDIYDGSLYKKFSKRGRLLSSPNNISFTWYSDGIPIFKSRRYSLWPLAFVVNELPYHKRILQENIIVAGLWFGPTDPVVNLFLKPFHPEFEILTGDGIEVKTPGIDNPFIVKAVLLYGTGDTPARCDFLRHVRFNGNYGCTVCNEKGYNVSGETYGNTHIYPFEGPCSLRTQQETDERAEVASNTGNPYFGVKGPTLLSKIMPDAVNGVCIDQMHSVFLGIVKKLMHLWFDVKYRLESFSLYQYVNVVDARLTNHKPPSFVQRGPPRSISKHLAYFKASEYKNFFFYYSVPILQDIMDQNYFDHYLKLVFAIFNLSHENVTDVMLSRADQCLVAFVSQFQALYGPQFMSMNAHLLRHLPVTVKRAGPLWTMSCFPFEDLNGQLGKKMHGTTHIGLQVYSNVAQGVVLPYLLSQLPDSIPKAFSLRILSNRKKQRLHEISNNTYIVGKVSKLGVIPYQIGRALQDKGIRCEKVGIFYRSRKGKQVFYSKNYPRSCSHLSYCVLIENNETCRFGIIKSFIQICQCDSDGNCTELCVKQYFAVVQKGTASKCFSASTSMAIGGEETMYPVPHLYSYNPQADVILESVSNLKYTCFLMEVGTRQYVAQPVNRLEVE